MLTKCIQNYTEEELKEMFPQFPYEKIHICYCYYHRSRTLTVQAFASKFNISTSTLYRYLKEFDKLQIRV